MSQLGLLRVTLLWVLLFSTLLLSSPAFYAQNSYSCDIQANDIVATKSSRRVSGQAISVTNGGYNEWSDVQNAVLEDNRHISVSVDPHRSSEVLRLSNFGFDLPDNVNITGIQVRMAGNADSDISPWEQVVRLTDASGNMVGDNRANHELDGDAWNIDTLSSIGYWTYGSSADLWDSNWSPSTVNNNNFGIALQTKSRNDIPTTLNLDQVIIIIFYDSPIMICSGHACVPVSVEFDEDVTSYNWSVQGGISWEPSSTYPNIINVLADDADFGDYEVCLDRTYNDGRRESCCRGITYKDCTTGSIGDFVWNDLNGNGFQDAGEPGLSDCRVFLFTESLDFVESVQTVNGLYLFENLPPDNYIVQVDTKDFVPTVSDLTNTTLNSDFFEAYLPGGSDIISLGANEHKRDIDFGLVEKGPIIIDVTVFEDDDRDDIQGDNEISVTGVTVELYTCDGQLVESMVTDTSGGIWFNSATRDSYYVRVILPTGYSFTGTGSVDGSNGPGTTPCYDAIPPGFSIEVGLIKDLAQIDVYTYNDINNDGVNDGNDLPLEGVGIEIYNCNGTLFSSLTSNDVGAAWQEDIPQGEYYIRLVAPEGFAIRPGGIITNANGPGTTDCLYTAPLGFSIEVAFVMDSPNVGVYIYDDINGDGINDINDPALSDITIEIYDCNGTFVTAGTTDVLGNIIQTLPDGSYYFKIVPQSGYVLGFASIIDGTNGPDTTPCLTTSPDGIDIEIGLVKSDAQIDVYVYHDVDDNGINDTNDPAVPNATVEIYSCTTGLIASIVTNNVGAVWQYNIENDDYYIRVIPPAGYVVRTGGVITNANGPGTTDCLNSAPIGFSVEVGLILESNIPNVNVYVYEDIDGNGENDNSDPALSNINVEIYDCNGVFVSATNTDALGNVVEALPDGSYYFKISPPSGYVLGFASIIDGTNGPDTTPCLTTSPDGIDIEIGLVRSDAQIDVYVYHDVDDNGINDTNDPAVPNATVEIYSCTTGLIASIVTNNVGAVWQYNIDNGDYYIRVIPPVGFEIRAGGIITGANGPGTTDCLNSAPIGFSIEVAIITTGNTSTTTVTGTIWQDDDGSLDNENEPGISGVTVSLFDCNDNLIATTTTDSSGQYIFDNIAAGNYYVKVDDRPGSIYAVGGSSDIDNSNGDGTTTCFVVDNDPVIIDIGYIPIATIGGLVFLDEGLDGILSNGDDRIEGIPVHLYASNGTLIQSLATDADGIYVFFNIVPGDYYVQFDVTDEYLYTVSNIGSDELFDSDVVELDGRTDVFSVIGGDIIQGINAGLAITSGCISGVFWDDTNRDGILDNAAGSLASGTSSNLRFSEERRIDNATITLYTQDGTLIATDITDIDGQYNFCDISSGQYYVEFVAPDNYVFSLANQGTDEALDSDVTDLVNGTTDIITITQNDIINHVSAGAYEQSTLVNGTLWYDANENGLLDPTESGLSNMTVNLIDQNNVIALTTQSNLGGAYSFTNPIEGTYTLELLANDTLELTLSNVGGDPSLYSHFDPATGRSASIVIVAGNLYQNINGGLIDKITSNAQASVSGRVWLDENKNGLLEIVERGLHDMTINLLRDDNTIMESSQSDADGNYKFTDLPAGDYRLQVMNEAAYDLTTALVGNDPAIQSHFNQADRRTDMLSVLGNDVVNNMHVGLVDKLSSMAGTIWNDENNNGLYGPDEIGVSGITINLLDSNDNIVQTAVSDASGDYIFEDITAGDYKLQVISGDAYNHATAYVGVNNNIYSHVYRQNGISPIIPIAPGEELININAGLVKAPNTIIAGRVWLDDNEDGILDDVESGIESVEVELYDRNDDLVASALTTANGDYAFENLEAGRYYVNFGLIADHKFTLIKVDGVNSYNSDVVDFDLGNTNAFNINPGQQYFAVHAGMIKVEEVVPLNTIIAGRVWLDDNEDGILDDVESGIESIEVELYDRNDDLVASALTTANGDYAFENLEAGRYYVNFGLIADHKFTLIKVDGVNSYNSDVVDFDLGNTNAFNINPGQQYFAVHAGMIKVEEVVPLNTIIAGRVWLDDNEDGILDDVESGIESIEVELYDRNDDLVASALTTANGDYAFENLEAGRYYVNFGLIADHKFTLVKVDGVNSYNSDVVDFDLGNTNAFNINPGQQYFAVHAGMIKVEEVDTGLGNIAGYVWEDMNADGTRSGDEVGQNGVRVSLIDDEGITVREATTMSDPDLGSPGYYSFNNIKVGEYTLSFQLDDDAVITTQGLDSKLIAEYVTDAFSVVSQSTVSQDAGYFYAGSIGDFVWNDANSNGIQDADEIGAQSFFIKLFDVNDQEIGFTFSDADGAYAFNNLLPGDYYVKVDFQLGISFSPSNGGDDNSDTNINNANGLGTTSLINIQSGTVDNSVDIGLIIATATVGDFVFSDVNANGIQDDDERGINDIDVELYDRNDNLVQTTTTANVGGEDGHYLFEDVVAGNYYIVFDIPSDMDISIKDQGGDDSKDSDVDNSQGYGSTSIFELSPGETDIDVDAGVVVSLSIGDRIWHDRNSDGLYDINEPGVSDVTVTLYNAAGDFIDDVESNNQGVYKFSNVTAGDYYVHFGIPDNFTFTSKGDGSVDNDSKVNSDGTTDLFTVGSGIGRADINAGLIRPTNEISGLAWWDDNEDGLYTTDEKLMEGVTIFLLDGNTNLLEQTETGITGRYAFTNIPNGPYIVQFVSEPDMFFSERNIGLDDKIDSDVDADGYSKIFNLTGQTVERYVYGGLLENGSPNISEVFPNPIPNGQMSLKVRARADDEMPQFNLYNLSGQLLESWSADMPQNAGWHSYKIQLNTIQSGQYLLKVRTNRTEEIHKVILVRE